MSSFARNQQQIPKLYRKYDYGYIINNKYFYHIMFIKSIIILIW